MLMLFLEQVRGRPTCSLPAGTTLVTPGITTTLQGLN